MTKLNRLKNIGIARVANAIPQFKDYLTDLYIPPQSNDVPWTPVKKPLDSTRIALVSTAGLHHSGQKPFNMNDPNGDPSYRIIDSATIESDHTLTHD